MTISTELSPSTALIEENHQPIEENHQPFEAEVSLM